MKLKIFIKIALTSLICLSAGCSFISGLSSNTFPSKVGDFTIFEKPQAGPLK